MLTVTRSAASVIQRVTAHPGLAPTSGLRITSGRSPEDSLEVKVVHRPEPGDRVLEHDGGRLFLAPAAADRVAGRELDAVTDDRGRVQFVARSAA